MEYKLVSSSVFLHEHLITYIEQSGTSRETILFVHGRCQSVRIWEHQFRDELLRNHRLLALDLPGHGGSDWVDSYSLGSFKQTILAFVEQLQLTNYFMVGLSLGGHIVLQALADLKGCKGIMALTMPISRPMEPNQMYYSTTERVYQANPSDVDIQAYNKQLLRFSPDVVPDFLTRDFKQTDPKVHVDLLQSIIEGDYENEQLLIKQSNLPVALVAGAEDQLHMLTYLEVPNPAAWRQEPQLINSAGHLPPWENSAEFNKLLIDFMRDCTLG